MCKWAASASVHTWTTPGNHKATGATRRRRFTSTGPPATSIILLVTTKTTIRVNHSRAIFGTYDRWEGLFTVGTYALVFWLAVQLIAGEGDAEWTTWSLLFSGYVIAVVAVLQAGFGVLGGGYWLSPYIRADATM